MKSIHQEYNEFSWCIEKGGKKTLFYSGGFWYLNFLKLCQIFKLALVSNCKLFRNVYVLLFICIYFCVATDSRSLFSLWLLVSNEKKNKKIQYLAIFQISSTPACHVIYFSMSCVFFCVFFLQKSHLNHKFQFCLVQFQWFFVCFFVC